MITNVSSILFYLGPYNEFHRCYTEFFRDLDIKRSYNLLVYSTVAFDGLPELPAEIASEMQDLNLGKIHGEILKLPSTAMVKNQKHYQETY